MDPLEEGKNTGVIVELRETDHFAGGETLIVYEPRNASGDWEKYRPTDEWQRRFLNGILGYDTQSCVTFSGIRNICMQLEFMLEHGLIPDDVVQQMHSLGYFDENGKINFSEWFSANTNGTTEQFGNSLQNFWDGVRRDGLLPQGDGPSVNDFTMDTGGFLDATKITDEQRAKAKKFFDLGFSVAYQWVVSSDQPGLQATFSYHLKQSPLHVLVPTCSTWNNPTVGVCPVKRVNHAVSNLAMREGDAYIILDHYNPFEKRLDWDYYVPFAIKSVVSWKRPGQAPAPFNFVFNVNLKYGMAASTQVHKLQEALQLLGYMKAGLFGPFGPSTRTALAQFQASVGIVDTPPGNNFGPQTRAALNKALSTI